jgi:hypothetical protein
MNVNLTNHGIPTRKSIISGINIRTGTRVNNKMKLISPNVATSIGRSFNQATNRRENPTLLIFSGWIALSDSFSNKGNTILAFLFRIGLWAEQFGDTYQDGPK